MELPEEIIDYILELADIRCRICSKRFNQDFFCRENRNMYCSVECYNFI